VCTGEEEDDVVDLLDDEPDDDDPVDEERDEYDVAGLETSSSRSLDDALVAVDEPDDEPDVDAALAVVEGACAANKAARPRNDAALTAPVTRRARRAGWGFFGGVMQGACAPPRKST
jgi:hypothetical protein